MRANLRITANFDSTISAQIKAATDQDNPALTNALIIDDAANLVHEIKIEYATDDDGNIYRRLNYKMVSMIGNKVVFNVQNQMAQELLYKVATALTGSTLFITDPASNSYKSRNFDKSMFILGANDGLWDDVLPTDKPKTKAKQPAKKEDDRGDAK